MIEYVVVVFGLDLNCILIDWFVVDRWFKFIGVYFDLFFVCVDGMDYF